MDFSWTDDPISEAVNVSLILGLCRRPILLTLMFTRKDDSWLQLCGSQVGCVFSLLKRSLQVARSGLWRSRYRFFDTVNSIAYHRDAFILAFWLRRSNTPRRSMHL